MLHSNDRIIKHKVGLLNLADELGNVAKACKMMGVSRDTFYRYKEAVDEGGVDALFDKNRRVPNPKNRVEVHVEEAVVKYATEQPAHGQVRVSNELRKKGTFVSPSGVRSIWLRHDLANFKQRLKALEALVAQDGIILTESQVQALERKKLDDEACGEIETAHPGYLGSQDTFYVGTFKGVRPMSIPTPKRPTASSTRRRRLSQQPTYSMTVSYPSTLHMSCLYCVSSLTGAPSTAASSSSMTTSSTWPLMKSSTPGPRRDIHRRTGSASASTRPSCRSFISQRYAEKSTTRSKSYKPIWTSGSITTIMSVPIRVNSAVAERRCRHWKMGKRSGRKNS